MRANVKKMQRARADRGKVDVGDAIFFTIIAGGISGFCLHKANLLQNGSPQHVATPVFFILGAIAGGQVRVPTGGTASGACARAHAYGVFVLIVHGT